MTRLTCCLLVFAVQVTAGACKKADRAASSKRDAAAAIAVVTVDAAPAIDAPPPIPVTPLPATCHPIEQVQRGGDPGKVGLVACTEPTGTNDEVEITVRRVVPGGGQVLWSDIADGLGSSYLLNTDDPRTVTVQISERVREPESDGEAEEALYVVTLELTGGVITEVDRFRDSGD